MLEEESLYVFVQKRKGYVKLASWLQTEMASIDKLNINSSRRYLLTKKVIEGLNKRKIVDKIISGKEEEVSFKYRFESKPLKLANFEWVFIDEDFNIKTESEDN